MWLPLLRFNNSVCKSWRALIQTSFFVNHQTTTTTTTTTTSSSSKFGSFILQINQPSRIKYGNVIKMFMLSSSGSGDNHSDDHQKKKKVFKLDDLGFSPFFKDFFLEDELRIVGSFDGIICLHDPHVMDEERGSNKQHYSNIRDVALWNPATRQFRILLKSIPIEENDGSGFVAFGFDVKTKDYKVLRITPGAESPMGDRWTCRVQLYSLSTDSWRLLKDINSLPVIPSYQHHGIYLNGSHFFVGRTPIRSYDDLMLLSFDFTKEIFTTMQLPDNCSIYKKVLSYLGKKWDVFKSLRIHDSESTVLSTYLGDKMTVFRTPRIDYDGGYCYHDIWVLNEQHDGSKESWTKLHSFRIKTKKKRPYSEPRCISNDGEFALTSTLDDDSGKKLMLFNLVTKEAIKDFTIGDDRECIAAYVYKEIMVSIMGGNVLLRWQLPTHGTTYKLNLDAPFIYGRRFGISLCLTSDTSGCIGVRSLKRYVKDATLGEAVAMLEAIKWAKKLELSPIIIESDSKKCVSFFMEDDDNDDDNNLTGWSSEALSILSEAKLLLNSHELGIISFQYCYRSRNYVADIAAKLGRDDLTCSCKDWTANFPGEMVMSLSKDLGIERSE